MARLAQSVKDIDTDDLINELLDRSLQGAITVTLPGDTPDSYTRIVRWKGDPHMLSGMATEVSMMVLKRDAEEAEADEAELCGNA